MKWQDWGEQCFVFVCLSFRVWPLSLLAFVAATRSLSLDRRKRLDYNKVGEEKNTKEQDSKPKQSPKDFLVAEHLLLRHVKPKKQHELVNLSQVRMCVYYNNICGMLCGQINVKSVQITVILVHLTLLLQTSNRLFRVRLQL